MSLRTAYILGALSALLLVLGGVGWLAGAGSYK